MYLGIDKSKTITSCIVLLFRRYVYFLYTYADFLLPFLGYSLNALSWVLDFNFFH